MRYGYSEVLLNPIKPVRQYGHASQVDKISEVHDDLKARIYALESDSLLFINVTCDLLGIDYHFTQQLDSFAASICKKPVKVIVSTSHTHYAGLTSDPDYRQQCLDAVTEGIRNLKMVEGQLSYTYKSIPFEGVGTSRISNHKAFVLLNIIQIYDGDREVLDIINHNCHPTILSGDDTHYFSSEYVGNAIAKLNSTEDCHHVFLQGAAGDVSTRFTRKSQDYSAVEQLADVFVGKIRELKQQPAEKHPLTSLDFREVTLKLTHTTEEVDTSLLPDNLSERELITIGYGKKARAMLLSHPEQWQKEMVISRMSLGEVSIIYAPNELFSFYLQQLDTSKAFLACYSNGYSPYVLPPDQPIFTYETFTDILSRESKMQLIQTIKSFN